jgi:mediator of RNA polymerase II transcription subunit 16
MAESGMAGKTVNPQLQQAYQKMQHVTSSGLVKVGELDKLLGTITQDIRQSYAQFVPMLVKQQAKPPQGKQIDLSLKTTQIGLELNLLLANSPPPPFLAIIKKFFIKDLAALRALTDPAKLFFANFDLLEVQDDKRSLANKGVKGVYVDIFKRTELKISSTQVWRRCTRCAAVMEDTHGTRPGLTFVLNQQRRCSCGGSWALLPKGKLFL